MIASLRSLSDSTGSLPDHRPRKGDTPGSLAAIPGTIRAVHGVEDLLGAVLYKNHHQHDPGGCLGI